MFVAHFPAESKERKEKERKEKNEEEREEEEEEEKREKMDEEEKKNVVGLKERYNEHKMKLSRLSIVVSTRENDQQQWTYLDNNQLLYLRTEEQGKTVKQPVIVLFPPTAATASVYSELLHGLAERGFRAVAVNLFPFLDYTVLAKCFARFLDELNLKEVSIFGSELGSYLALIFSQMYPKRITSLIMTNPIADPEYFIKKHGKASVSLETQPASSLRTELKKYCVNWPKTTQNESLPEKVEIMKEASEIIHAERGGIGRRDGIARLTLLRKKYKFDFQSESMMELPITIIISGDNCVSFPQQVLQTSTKLLWSAQIADIKWGGDYPFLSNLDEFMPVILMHLGLIEKRLQAKEKENNKK